MNINEPSRTGKQLRRTGNATYMYKPMVASNRNTVLLV